MTFDAPRFAGAFYYAIRVALSTVALALILGVSSCGDSTGVSSPGPEFIISNPDSTVPSPATGAAAMVGAVSEGPVVFVSLPPGSIPGGTNATITNLSSSEVVVVELRDGGFDPVRVHARAGDRIGIEVAVAAPNEPVRVIEIVNPRRRPIIVRTDPPNRKRDVPLNKIISVVFSEPIDAKALTDGSIRLVRGGTAVAAQLAFTDELQIAVQLTPEQSLASGTEYEVAISSAVRDLNGDALEEPVAVSFTTVTLVATQLRFIGPPETPLSGMTVTPALRVAAVDDAGNVVPTFGAPITIAMGVNPGGVTVTGNLTSIAVDGVALFDNLVFNRSTQGVTLVATTPGLVAGQSAAFDVMSGGKIAFTSPWPGSFPQQSTHIHVLNLDGGGVTQLTTGSVRDGSAAWSPDGTRIAFSRVGDAATQGIYIMNADGSGLTRMTTSGTMPTWSPDGARIAYSDSGIRAIDSNGTPLSPPQRLTEGRWDLSPAWSPDGSTLAFTRDVELFGDFWNFVFLMGADGSIAHRLTGSCTYGCGATSAEGHPSWSPDGQTLTYWSYSFGITVIGRDGTQARSALRQLNGPGQTGTWYDSNPDWSPDGKLIVFVADLQLYLTRATGAPFWIPLLSVPGGVGDPAWSRRPR